MADPFARFDGIFFEKSRLAIVALLYMEEYAAFTTLRERLDATDGAVYSHLERLIEGGYVEKRKEIVGIKAQTVYRLTKKGKTEFNAYLGVMEELLTSRSRKEGKN